MATNYDALLEKVYELHDLEKAAAVLAWDKETNMPAAGMTGRIQQITTLRRLHHQKFTADAFGDLIEAAAAELADAAYDSNEASLIRYLRYAYAQARRLPPAFVKRSSETSGAAYTAWLEAREANDFAIFAPHLEKVVALNREMAELYGYEDEPYDPLLDKFEQGMKTADVRAIFNAVKAELTPLRAAVAERAGTVDDSFLHQPYDVAKQKEVARRLAAAVGYDFNRGHLGTAVHPFSSSFSRDDARITTRWNPHFISAALFATLHEAGHAIYEQGTAPDLARTPLARGTSSGIHESQSRMMENIVGRSRGFWQAHFGLLQAAFPAQLGDVNAEQFYQAVNKSRPSYIRVEADELTYNFHIILRFELEQALLNGELAVAELPAAWNDKMAELLGITPPDDLQGCLQDIHWTSPTFGYFPTYALGNLYAAQFWETAVRQNPQIGVAMAQGDPAPLVAWLRENVHRHGRKFTPAEIAQRATGQTLSHKPFIRYITAKFSELYRL